MTVHITHIQKLVLCRVKTSLSTEQQDMIKHGPGLSDFLRTAPPTPDHLKRKKGQRLRLPHWLKTDIPVGRNYTELRENLHELGLHTVCEEAKCPNIGECWGGGEGRPATATIMVRREGGGREGKGGEGWGVEVFHKYVNKSGP